MTVCADKTRFESRADAKIALRKMKGRPIGNTGLRPYRCLDCGFFHHGHLNPSVIAGDMTRGECYG